MIRRDIEQDRYVRLEIVHVIQLERTQLNHVVVMILMRHLQCQRVTDVSRQTDVQPCIAQDIIDERSSGCLAVRTGDTDHLRVRVTRSKLNLRDDRSSLCLQFLNQRSCQRNTRRFHHLIRIENQLLAMLSVLPLHTVLIQQRAIRFTDRPAITHEHVKTFLLRQNSSSATTLASS